MNNRDIEPIVSRFAFSGTLVRAEELMSGNINMTYRLTFREESGKENDYVLQRLNTEAFHFPDELMNNVIAVTKHIGAAMKKEGIDSTRRILTFVPTKDGSYLYRDAEGGAWRADVFVTGATAYDAIEDPALFYEAGRGFGEFQKYLFDFPADRLFETIPDFHNTPKRYEAFLRAVKADRVGRADAVREDIAFFEQRADMMAQIVTLTEKGVLPLRVTHNDTKLNNVLIDDETGKALCVIDLDTVMPGSVLYDYGDAVRYGADTAAEDEPDIGKIDFDMELFRRFTEGFVSEIRGAVTDEEIRLLPLGIKVITCELAMRFMTDYLDGDRYFKIRYPEHNLVRARSQMQLLRVVESKYAEMEAYAASLIG